MDLIIIFTLLILLFSIIIHEVAHGSVAYALGDSTAKDAGRLDLNPLKHLDPIGSVLLPLLLAMSHLPIIGWAKPVPVNSFNFYDQKWGKLKVALAGPMANFILALIFGLIVKFFTLPEGFMTIAIIIIFYNIVLGLFNLIPIPPLDGSHILFSILPDSFNNFKIILSQYGFFILIFVVFLFPGGISWIFSLAQNIVNLFLGKLILF